MNMVERTETLTLSKLSVYMTDFQFEKGHFEFPLLLFRVGAKMGIIILYIKVFVEENFYSRV